LVDVNVFGTFGKELVNLLFNISLEYPNLMIYDNTKLKAEGYGNKDLACNERSFFQQEGWSYDAYAKLRYKPEIFTSRIHYRGLTIRKCQRKLKI